MDAPQFGPIESFKPNPDEPFYLSVTLSIGLKGEKGSDLFVVQVVNSFWLAQETAKGIQVIGRHFIITRDFDYDSLYQKIAAYCEKCTGENWEDVVPRLSRLAEWEYEDYNSGLSAQGEL